MGAENINNNKTHCYEPFIEEQLASNIVSGQLMEVTIE
jgi:hypothetical protein